MSGNFGGAGIAETQQKKLILHFDVNKTIIMMDSSNALNSVQNTVSTDLPPQSNRFAKSSQTLHGVQMKEDTGF